MPSAPLVVRSPRRAFLSARPVQSPVGCRRERELRLLPSAAAVLPPPRLVAVARGDPARGQLEQFIAGVFEQTYQARATHFAEHLLGLRDAEGRWCAALGYTPAAGGPLFVEHYLDAPAEQAIGAATGQPLRREVLAEVGNLAASADGLGRLLIAPTTVHLFERGIEQVVFTATRGLANAFRRLRVPLHELAPADPARVPGAASAWGSYYASGPRVMTGRVASGLAAARLPGALPAAVP